MQENLNRETSLRKPLTTIDWPRLNVSWFVIKVFFYVADNRFHQTLILVKQNNTRKG